MMPRSLRDYADGKFFLLPVRPVAAGSITLVGFGFCHKYTEGGKMMATPARGWKFVTVCGRSSKC